MSNVVDIGSKLFGGVVELKDQEPTFRTCVDMFKLAWRLVETANVKAGKWATDDELTKMAYLHLETLLSGRGPQ